MDLMGRKSEQVKFKMLAIPWFRLNFKLFYNREKKPRSRAEANFGLRHPAGMMPCKPKSGTFSLREKSGSSPLRPRRSFPQGISRRESRYLTRSRGKYFFLLALLWIKKMGYREFQASANSHIIQCEHH